MSGPALTYGEMVAQVAGQVAGAIIVRSGYMAAHHAKDVAFESVTFARAIVDAALRAEPPEDLS